MQKQKTIVARLSLGVKAASDERVKAEGGLN
jgi:hypothetical protein